MDKVTAQYLDQQLDRLLEDPDGVNFADSLRIDMINDAIIYVHQILVGMNREGVIDLYNASKRLEYENFSYKDQITLPDDYDIWVQLKEFQTDTDVEIIQVSKLYNNVLTPYGAIYASSVTSPLPDGSNSGTDDFELEVDGDYSGTDGRTYTFEIEAGGATFKWNNGVDPETAAVALTGDWQTIEANIKIKTANTSGYTAGDKWTVLGYLSKVVHVLEMNLNPEADYLLRYARQPSLVTALGSSDYLPFPRFYQVLKLITETLCRAYNEEDVNVDYVVNQSAMLKAKDVARRMNAGQKQVVEPGKTFSDYV